MHHVHFNYYLIKSVKLPDTDMLKALELTPNYLPRDTQALIDTGTYHILYQGQNLISDNLFKISQCNMILCILVNIGHWHCVT